MKTTWESDFALRTMGHFCGFPMLLGFSPLVTKYCVLVALFEKEKWGFAQLHPRPDFDRHRLTSRFQQTNDMERCALVRKVIMHLQRGINSMIYMHP